MKSDAVSKAAAAGILTLLVCSVSPAQWLNYPTPGTPRLPDGKPNLAAPTPRAPDGRPDLSGIWRGAGPLYRFNIAQDLTPEDVQPWAEALFLQRVRDNRKDSPLARCQPVSVPFHNFFNLTRIVQTPGLTMIVYESPNSPHRTVFTDGRDLPENPNPSWLGYSIGRWEGDTLVITTAGFNDLGWLDSAGHPQTESLRITERLYRRDFGHMDFEMTIDDPKVFTRPFTIKSERLLAPDTDLLEDFCENERDRISFSGDSGIRLSPDVLRTYAGVYELSAGEVVVTVTGDMLFVQGLNEPKLPLVAQSETQFMSTATPTGFEFIKDSQGKVTHLLVRGAAGDQQAARRSTEDGGALQAIAPTGTLRVTFLGGNPTQGKVDPKTGAVSGPVKDLSEELGRKLGVPVSVTPLNGVPAVLESLKAHTADIGFAAIDPTRATEVDFSQPYLLGWSSYIVPVDSALRSVKDVDRAGIRVAANAGDAPDLFLTRNLKNATLTHLKSMDEVLAALVRGEIAGYATNRQRLLQIVAEDSRFRVLEDNFFAVEQAIAVPKGNAAVLEIVNQFLDDAKASGFLRGLIDRSGLAASVDPAPPRAK